MAYTLGQAACRQRQQDNHPAGNREGPTFRDQAARRLHEIDPAELHRAFPSPGGGSGTMARSVTVSDTGELRVEVEMLRERLVEKDNVIGDLRRRLDQSEVERRQAQERLTALLTDQRPSRRGRWWPWG